MCLVHVIKTDKEIIIILFLLLRHEGEMYKTLLSDYDARQRELVLENAELNKVLQQIKKEMVSILSAKKPNLNSDKHQDDATQVEHVVSSQSLVRYL